MLPGLTMRELSHEKNQFNLQLSHLDVRKHGTSPGVQQYESKEDPDMLTTQELDTGPR